MIAKSLYVENFRSFKGPEEINFAFNDKKITIVRGRNDVGKTNLLNVIRWCLYDEEAKDEVSSQEIYNEYAFLEIGVHDVLNVIAKLTFEDELNRDIVIERKYTFEKISDERSKKPKTSFRICIIQKDGRKSEVEFPDTYINTHFPKTLEKFFIFNGEELSKFFKKNSGNIKEDIYRLSQLNLLERINKHMNKLKNKLLEEKSIYEPIYAKLKQEEDELKNSIKKDLKEKEEKEREKRILEEKKKDLENKHLEEYITIIKDIESLEKELKNKESEYKSLESNNLKFLIDNFNNIFGYEVLDKLDIIKSESDNSNAIKINANVLKNLLNNKKCICGSELDVGSTKYMEVEKLLKAAKETSELDTLVENLSGRATSIKSHYPKDFNVEYEKLDEELKEIEDCIDGIKSSIKLKKQQIGVDDDDDIKKMASQIEYYKGQIESLTKQIGILEGNIENTNRELRKKQKELVDATKNKDKEDDLDKKIRFCETIEETSLKIFENLKETTLETLQKLTTDEFKKIHWKGLYKSVDVDRDFNVSIVKEKNRRSSATDPSVGGSLSLALSFVLSLNSLSGFQLPLFIDTPSGPLETTNRSNIGEVLADYSKNKQVIIFALGGEYLSFNKNIDPFVGEYYNLDPSESGGEYTEIIPVSQEELINIIKNEESEVEL